MSGFKVKPNNTRPLVDPAKLAAFAAGAEMAQELSKAPESDDKRRVPAFSVRLTERELLALKRIAETTPESMHAVIVRVLRKELGFD